MSFDPGTLALPFVAVVTDTGYNRLGGIPVTFTVRQGNGRIEATEVDVAAKTAGRVAEILVNEGDFVKAGDVIGTRANGEVVRAPHDGYIVFPNALAEANYEWFYLAAATRRFNP